MKDPNIKLPTLPEPFTYTRPGNSEGALFHVGHMQDYARSAIEADRQRSDETDVAQMVEALEELVDLMEDTRQGEYVPDSFTTQPARIALNAYRKRRGEPVAWMYEHDGYMGEPIITTKRWKVCAEPWNETPLYNCPQPADRKQQGEVVVTKDESGYIVAVTRQDDEGRILSVIAEADRKYRGPAEQYNHKRIGWELERTAMGDGYYGNALRVAKDIPGLTDQDRAVLDRYATGLQHGTDHIALQNIAMRVYTSPQPADPIGASTLHNKDSGAQDGIHAPQPAEQQTDVAQLLEALEELHRDAELLDWLEERVKELGTHGVSLDYVRFVEDGYVVEKGFRVMRRHYLGDRHSTLRAALEAEKKEES